MFENNQSHTLYITSNENERRTINVAYDQNVMCHFEKLKIEIWPPV